MTASSARDRLWPLWGVAAGAAGFAATVLFDHRPESELEAAGRGEDFVVTPEVMTELTRLPNYIGFLVGFAAVALLVVFAAAWRSRVEAQHPRSIAASVVSGGVLVTAAGLALGYGWKGALANYGFDGPEKGLYEHDGLFVYFMLTDFGPYIPWLGVLVAFAGMAWMAWVERLISRVLGAVLTIYVALIVYAYVAMGVPGIAGPASGLVLIVAGLWLSIGRSRITLRPLTVAPRAAREAAPAEEEPSSAPAGTA
ncbi:hypothetical protein H4J02_02155 [Protaetiibacter sp. SSC-01]|uniref:hypothetical protein n=1 Tax=Protaetiibacter sp. SSC-01 TaxID=2759943 RepID=UPI001656E3CE|nr:hypothetical protein [Protaetiibacter sp. SSC-01]QNO37866.1 hypothetical protein H4J02_02155 [Protaetiibacter sp. SSC-01]